MRGDSNMNKKNIIKKYEEVARQGLGISDDESIRKIIKKAQNYNIALFQDEILVSKLLDIKTVQELPKDELREISRIFTSLIDAEEKAQLS